MAITFEELKKNSQTQSKQEPITFESLKSQEIKEEPKIQPITFESVKKEKEENEIGVGENIYRTAVGALRDVAQGTIDFSEWIESPFDLITPDKYKGGVVKTEEDGYQVLYGDEYKEAKTRMKSQGLKVIDLPKVKEPEYFGGSFVRDVTGFVIPFSKLKILTPTSKIGKGTEIVARGALAEQLAFSPYEQRLSNLVEEYPSLKNPVTKYLKADPNDTESEARFKMALEGVGLGTAIEGIVWATKLIKPGLSRIFKTEKPEPKT